MKMPFAAALVAAALVATAGPSAATHVYGSSLDAQRAELLACKDALGHRGSARLVVDRTWNGAVHVRMAPYDRIDAADAAAINACADRRDATARTAYYGLLPSSPGCYRGAPLLYRGNLYCFANR